MQLVVTREVRRGAENGTATVQTRRRTLGGLGVVDGATSPGRLVFEAVTEAAGTSQDRKRNPLALLQWLLMLNNIGESGREACRRRVLRNRLDPSHARHGAAAPRQTHHRVCETLRRGTELRLNISSPSERSEINEPARPIVDEQRGAPLTLLPASRDQG